MLLNRWRKYPKRKPKEEGWYQCIVKYGFGGTIENPIVLDLYWYRYSGNGFIWEDRRRISVFDGYKVYLPNRAPLDTNRIDRDNVCERIDVIAWRKLPRIPKKWRKKLEDE